MQTGHSTAVRNDYINMYNDLGGENSMSVPTDNLEQMHKYSKMLLRFPNNILLFIQNLYLVWMEILN